MLKDSLNELIATYPNFPKEGILFRDMMPVLENPEVFNELIASMSNLEISQKADAILAIDARGFLLGSAISLKLSKPLIVARKPGKLPGDIISQSYSLEYGSNSLSIQKNAIKPYKSFVIIDDLLATGGTVECVSKILSSQQKKVTGLNVVIELSELNGSSKFNFPVSSQVNY